MRSSCSFAAAWALSRLANGMITSQVSPASGIGLAPFRGQRRQQPLRPAVPALHRRLHHLRLAERHVLRRRHPPAEQQLERITPRIRGRDVPLRHGGVDVLPLPRQARPGLLLGPQVSPPRVIPGVLGGPRGGAPAPPALSPRSSAPLPPSR